MADVDEYLNELQAASMGREARMPISNAFSELQKNGKSVATLNGKTDTYFAKQSDMAKLLPLDQSPIKRSTRLVTSGGIWAIFGDISAYLRVYPEGTENPSEQGWYEIPMADNYHAIERPGVNQNPQAKGWYEYYQGSYILTTDTQTITKEFVAVSADPDHYEEVTPEEGDNPVEKGWYELVDQNYILTTDTEVDPEKTYYEFIKGPNPAEEGWYEKDGDIYYTTSDTTVLSGKTYYEYVVTEKTYYEKQSSVGCLYALTEDTSVDNTKTYYKKEFHIDWRDD
jgi:hypothetical protein